MDVDDVHKASMSLDAAAALAESELEIASLQEQLATAHEQLRRRNDDFAAVGKLLTESGAENRRLQALVDENAARRQQLEQQYEHARETIRGASAANASLQAEQDLFKQHIREKAPSLLSAQAIQSRQGFFMRIGEARELLSPRHVPIASPSAELSRTYDGPREAKTASRLTVPISLGALSGGAWVPQMSQTPQPPGPGTTLHEGLAQQQLGADALRPLSRPGTPKASEFTSSMLSNGFELERFRAASSRASTPRGSQRGSFRGTPRGSIAGGSPRHMLTPRVDVSRTIALINQVTASADLSGSAPALAPTPWRLPEPRGHVSQLAPLV